MTEAEKRRIQEESRVRARESMRLSQEGKYRCRFCKEEKPLAEGIVAMWGGTVLFAMCPECFPGRPIVLREQETSDGKRAVYVGFLRDSDRPADLIVPPAMSDVDRLVRNAVAKPKKLFED